MSSYNPAQPRNAGRFAETTTPADQRASAPSPSEQEVLSDLTALWNTCYIADTEDEALAQAWLQLAPYEGKVVIIDRLTGSAPGDNWSELELVEPVAVKVVGMLNSGEWYGSELIPEWTIRPTDPDQTIAVRDADDTVRHIRIGDIEDLAYSAPGIGTREGFGNPANAVFIEPKAT